MTTNLPSGSKDTIIVDDKCVEVEFGVNILSSRSLGLEFGIEDTIDDADLLSSNAEALATPDKLTIYIPDEGIKRDGRRNISLLVCF